MTSPPISVTHGHCLIFLYGIQLETQDWVYLDFGTLHLSIDASEVFQGFVVWNAGFSVIEAMTKQTMHVHIF